jgi:hypothetical protein
MKCLEIPNPSLITISANSSLIVDHAAALNATSYPTSACPSQRLDAQIKGLIRCESCSRTFLTRGGYKYVSLLIL